MSLRKTMTPERLQLLLMRLRRFWKVCLLFALGSFWVLLILHLINHKLGPSDKFIRCNGTFLNPINTALYRNKLMNPKSTVKNWRKFEQNFFDEMPKLYNRFHAIIFDCPLSLGYPSLNYSLYYYAFLMAVARFNQERSRPLNVWLRLDKQNEKHSSITTACIDLAESYNKIFPGSVRGVLGNSDNLLAYYAAKQNAIFYLKNNQPACKLYSEECFELLSAQGVKFGLILNADHCKRFPNLVPYPLIRKFDEIFYFERHRFQKTLGNVTIVPTLRVSSDFIKCKDYIAELVPYSKEVNYVIREEFETKQPHWKNSSYPYCLKLEEGMIFLKEYNT